MAILLADGFDFYNVPTDLALVGAPWIQNSANLNAATPYSVGQSVSFNSSPSLTSAVFSNSVTIFISATIYTTSSYTGAAGTGFYIQLIETAGNQVCLHWAMDGNFYVRAGGLTGTIIGTFAHGMAPSSWCHWQAKVVIDPTAGSVELRKNNNPVDDYSVTGINTRSGTTNSYVNKMTIHSSSVVVFIMDDLFVNSGSGAVPNDWPGQLRAIQLMPTADTAQKDLTPLSGGSNFAMVDELKLDQNTSYVFGATAGQTDIYNMADLTVTPTAIPLVTVRHAMAKSDTGARSATTQVRSGATTQDQATVLLATSYQWQDTYFTVDPNTSAAWTFAGVNALQCGPKVVA
jgi:hypothetical protein